MAMGRGMGAYNEAAEAAKNARGSYGARVFKMADGERVLVRFRGFIKQPSGVEWNAEYKAMQPWPGQQDVEKMSPPAIRRLCEELGVYSAIERGDKIHEVLGQRLADRAGHLEPFVYVQHYIHNNVTRQSYLTCARQWDYSPTEVARNDQEKKPPLTSCVPCMLEEDGDRRISSKNTSNFSLIPRRSYHYEKTAEQPGRRSNSNQRGTKPKDDKKGDFQYCSNTGYLPDGRCNFCQRKVEAKPEGIQRFPLSGMFVPQLYECADRIYQRCAACNGFGKISVVGWCCALCTEPLDNVPDSETTVKCPECKHVGKAKEELSCDRSCATPRRGQIFDTDVLITRTGAKKSTAYSFVEQFPFEQLPDDLMKYRLPDWEASLRPSGTAQQSRAMGLGIDPFTQQRVGGANEEQPGDTETYDGHGDAPGNTEAPVDDIPY